MARRFVDGDLVTATVAVEDDGRGTVVNATLCSRSRRLLAGLVETCGATSSVAVDPTLSSQSWRLPVSTGHLPAGTGVVFSITGHPGRPWHAGAVVAGPFTTTDVAWVRALASVRALDSLAAPCVPAPFTNPDVDVMAILRGDALAATTGTDSPPPRTTQSTQSTQSTGVSVPSRRDRRGMPIFTIDGASTRDIDDAIFAELVPGGVRVEVHIADVAAAIPAGSALDATAAARATSVYLLGHNIPMLPRHLSEDALSLVAASERNTLAVAFTVITEDTPGAIVDVDVFRASIRSAARLDYDTVEAHLIAGADLPAPAAVAVALAAAVIASNALSLARESRHTVRGLFVDPQLVVAVAGGLPVASEPPATPAASDLIERLMVAANESVARWLCERDLPALFRTHAGFAALDFAAMELFAGGPLAAPGVAPTAAAVCVVQERLAATDPATAASFAAVAAAAMGRARYRALPEHHFGLDSLPYCHFTSPIRRYADLVVHRVIAAALDGLPGPYSVADLDDLAAHIDVRTGAAARAESLERALLWGLALGATLASGGVVTEVATVSRLTPKGAVVRINRLGVTGFVSAGSLGRHWDVTDDGFSATTSNRSGARATLRLGASFDVELTSVAAVGGQLSFVPAHPVI